MVRGESFFFCGECDVWVDRWFTRCWFNALECLVYHSRWIAATYEKWSHFFTSSTEVFFFTADPSQAEKLAIRNRVLATNWVRGWAIEIRVGVGLFIVKSSDEAVKGWSQIEIQEGKLVVLDGPSEFQARIKIIYEGGEIFVAKSLLPDAAPTISSM